MWSKLTFQKILNLQNTKAGTRYEDISVNEHKLRIYDNDCPWVKSAAFTETFSIAIKILKQYTLFLEQTASFYR
jgi:hypothetical protein